MSDILKIDAPELFLAVTQESKFPGHITVHKLKTFSKSCVLRTDFEPTPFGMVFVQGAVVGSAPLSNYRKLSVEGCPNVLESSDLLKLFEKLKMHREIVNMHGQVMIGLRQPLVDVNGVVKAEYIRCSDVFLWSDFGGCLPLRLWSRYVFCTERFVDDPQLVLDGREGEEINILRKEALELQRQITEQKAVVAELRLQISKQQGAGSSTTSSVETSLRQTVEYWKGEAQKFKNAWEITEKDRLKLGSEKNRAEREVNSLTSARNSLQFHLDQLKQQHADTVAQAKRDRESAAKTIDDLSDKLYHYSDRLPVFRTRVRDIRNKLTDQLYLYNRVDLQARDRARALNREVRAIVDAIELDYPYIVWGVMP
uniref:P42 protein n=1 Tax=Peanut clump virus TaxID=28355 RepID=A0A8G1GLZ5_9VIRU|nr:P42 protein [Peanut clump virus]